MVTAEVTRKCAPNSSHGRVDAPNGSSVNERASKMSLSCKGPHIQKEKSHLERGMVS